MKKLFYLLLVFILAVPLVLGACGKKEEAPAASTPATDAPVPTDDDIDQDDEDDVDDDDADDADDGSVDYDELAEVVIDLIEDVNTIKRLDSGNLAKDESNVYTNENGYTYRAVAEDDFQSIGDIWALLFGKLTPDAAAGYFPFLARMEDEPPQYVMADTGNGMQLFVIDGGKGSGQYKIQSEIHFENVTDSSFDAIFDVTLLSDDPETMNLHCVKSDETGDWMIDSMETE